METLTLFTLVKLISPNLKVMLTIKELETPVVLKNGISSVSDVDILEIIEASILLNDNGAYLH